MSIQKLKQSLNEWGGMATLLGMVAVAFLHLANKMDGLRADMHGEITAMRRDMYEQHVKFAEQMARQGEQLTRQDAEFKAHMVYYHHQ